MVRKRASASTKLIIYFPVVFCFFFPDKSRFEIAKPVPAFDVQRGGRGGRGRGGRRGGGRGGAGGIASRLGAAVGGGGGSAAADYDGEEYGYDGYGGTTYGDNRSYGYYQNRGGRYGAWLPNGRGAGFRGRGRGRGGGRGRGSAVAAAAAAAAASAAAKSASKGASGGGTVVDSTADKDAVGGEAKNADAEGSAGSAGGENGPASAEGGAESKGGAADAAAEKPKGPTFEERQAADATSVYVTGLHLAVDEDQLDAHFKDCGTIVRSLVRRNQVTSYPKGSAYVQFENVDARDLALKKEGSELRGRVISVIEKMTFPDFVAAGGRGRGHRGRGRRGYRGRGGRRGRGRFAGHY